MIKVLIFDIQTLKAKNVKQLIRSLKKSSISKYIRCNYDLLRVVIFVVFFMTLDWFKGFNNNGKEILFLISL